MFKSVAPQYQEALEKSGYNHKLVYHPQNENPKKTTTNRARKIVWFNPPYSINVETNIGAKFLALVDKHFPKSLPLSKIFSRNSMKVSYRCTPNLANIISGHNSTRPNGPISSGCTMSPLLILGLGRLNFLGQFVFIFFGLSHLKFFGLGRLHFLGKVVFIFFVRSSLFFGLGNLHLLG